MGQRVPQFGGADARLDLSLRLCHKATRETTRLQRQGDRPWLGCRQIELHPRLDTTHPRRSINNVTHQLRERPGFLAEGYISMVRCWYSGGLISVLVLSTGCPAAAGGNRADTSVLPSDADSSISFEDESEFVSCVPPAVQSCHTAQNACFDSYSSFRELDCLGDKLREPSLADTPHGALLAYTEELANVNRVRLISIDPMGRPRPRTFRTIPNAISPHLTWRDPNLVLVTTEGNTRRQINVTSWDIEGNLSWQRSIESTDVIEHTSNAVFNGISWVVAWRTPTTVHIGAITPGTYDEWSRVNIPGRSVSVATDLVSGRTWLAADDSSTESVYVIVFQATGSPGISVNPDADGFHRFGSISIDFSPSRNAVVAAGYSLFMGRRYFTVYTLPNGVLGSQRLESNLLTGIGGYTSITTAPLTRILEGGYFSAYSMQTSGWSSRYSVSWAADRRVGCSILGGFYSSMDTIIPSHSPPIFAIARTTCGYLSIWDNGDLLGVLHANTGTIPQ